MPPPRCWAWREGNEKQTGRQAGKATARLAKGGRCLLDLLQKLPNPVNSLVNLLHAGGEAQAYVRVESAVIPGDDGDVVLLQQGSTERHRVGDLHPAGLLADVS